MSVFRLLATDAELYQEGAAFKMSAMQFALGTGSIIVAALNLVTTKSSRGTSGGHAGGKKLKKKSN